MQKEIKNKYKKLLDLNNVLKNTPNLNKLKVILKHDKVKGTCLFASKNIKKGEVISFYKVTVFNYKNYDSPANNTYLFDVYNKKEKSLKSLVGDIDLTSFPDPLNNIPYWAPFANESSEETSNSEMDVNTEFNYVNRNRIKIGDNVVYNLVANRNIKKGEEITWYYGPEYNRNYVLE